MPFLNSRHFGDMLLPLCHIRVDRLTITVLVHRLTVIEQQMPESQWHDRAIQNEHAADARAETEVQHSTAFITAERLHARVVHDAQWNTERGGVVEAAPSRRRGSMVQRPDGRDGTSPG